MSSYFVNISDDEIITGGLIAAGMNIVMEGSVKGGLKAYGGHVVISGNSQDTVDFWGGDVLLSGNFQDKVKGTAENLTISGTFEKDLEVNAEYKITITPTAVIKGDLIYSGARLDRKEGSQIFGKIIPVDVGDIGIEPFHAEPKEVNIWFTLLGKIYWYLSVLFIGFFIKYFMPRQSEKVIDTLVSDPITKNLKRGFLFCLLGPLIILISFTTVIGVPFGLICMAIYFLFFYPMSVIYSGVWIGRKVLSYFSTSFSDHFILPLAAAFIVVELVSLIPFIEWFLKIFLMVVAVGAIWRVTWSAVKTSREDTVDATSS